MRWFAMLVGLLFAANVWADAFENYTNPVLAKVPEAAEAKAIQELTPELILDNDSVLPNVKAAFIVILTNDNR